MAATAGGGAVGGVGNYGSRAEWVAARAEHIEEERRRRAAEDARHKKERKDKLMRYIVLIVCFVVIICSLLAMAGISRRVIGKWWHGAPDEPLDSSSKISHSTLLPGSGII